MHVLHVLGTRRDFLKAAPVVAALRRRRVRQTLVHTGQPQHGAVPEDLLQAFDLPEPRFNLAVGSGTHTWQTAEIMSRLEPVALRIEPDLVLVYGDVNSTVAAALAASKLGLRVGHVDAGLRSFDRTLPEEVNRVVTDQISDLLFTSSAEAGGNLARESVPAERVHQIGNVTIDTLVRLLPQALAKRDAAGTIGLNGHRYALVTLHRPYNVDDEGRLAGMLDVLGEFSRHMIVVFSVTPRTAQRIRTVGPVPPDLRLVEPMGYVDFLSLEARATVAITDSGSIQDETTFLAVPCVTVWPATERHETVTMGSNTVVADATGVRAELERVLAGEGKTGSVPPLWDGCAAERLAAVVCR